MAKKTRESGFIERLACAVPVAYVVTFPIAGCTRIAARWSQDPTLFRHLSADTLAFFVACLSEAFAISVAGLLLYAVALAKDTIATIGDVIRLILITTAFIFYSLFPVLKIAFVAIAIVAGLFHHNLWSAGSTLFASRSDLDSDSP